MAYSGDGGDGEWQIYHAGGDGWYLNQHADAHILTLEDPVEYLMQASDV